MIQRLSLFEDPGEKYTKWFSFENPEGVWVNFMREDYVSSVAYFYLNRPVL